MACFKRRFKNVQKWWEFNYFQLKVSTVEHLHTSDKFTCIQSVPGHRPSPPGRTTQSILPRSALIVISTLQKWQILLIQPQTAGLLCVRHCSMGRGNRVPTSCGLQVSRGDGQQTTHYMVCLGALSAAEKSKSGKAHRRGLMGWNWGCCCHT